MTGQRTHCLRMERRPGVAFGFLFPVLVCQICGEVWPDDADRTVLEAQPCGTRSDRPATACICPSVVVEDGCHLTICPEADRG